MSFFSWLRSWQATPARSSFGNSRRRWRMSRPPAFRPGCGPRADALEAPPAPSSFSGTVSNDAAGSGTYSGQPGLAGWTVGLDDNRDGVLSANEPSAVTDASGHYSLDTTGQPL